MSLPARRSAVVGTVLVLAAALLLPGAPSAAAAPRARPADLTVTATSATASARTLDVTALVVNRGKKRKPSRRAPASTVGFTIAPATAATTGGTELGGLPVRALRPGRSATVAGRLAVPAVVPAGTYVVVACADAGDVVRERRELNNCTRSQPFVLAAVGTTPSGPTVSVTYSSAAGSSAGTVTGSATDGVCTPNPVTGGGTCTVTAGVGTVTLTATSKGPFFTGWQAGPSGPCDGAQSGPTVVFTAPVTNKECRAGFTL